MNKAVIYGKEFPPCQFCEATKRLLKSENIDYDFKEINETVITHIKETQNKAIKSIPQIFVDDKYVGGYHDLVTYIQDIKSIKGLEL